MRGMRGDVGERAERERKAWDERVWGGVIFL